MDLVEIVAHRGTESVVSAGRPMEAAGLRKTRRPPPRFPQPLENAPPTQSPCAFTTATTGPTTRQSRQGESREDQLHSNSPGVGQFPIAEPGHFPIAASNADITTAKAEIRALQRLRPKGLKEKAM